MKYKITNKLESNVRFNGITFGPKETKILEVKPTSDKFNVEQLEETEKKKTERRDK
jgi:hypothetical protein